MNEFPKWRPVTERPEVEDEYLVTVRSNLDLAGLSRRDRERRVLRYVCGQWLGYPDRFIVGWMPMPPECEEQKAKEPGIVEWRDAREHPEEPGLYCVAGSAAEGTAHWSGIRWFSTTELGEIVAWLSVSIPLLPFKFWMKL